MQKAAKTFAAFIFNSYLCIAIEGLRNSLISFS